MALKKIGGTGNGIKLTGFAEGESITGYVTAFPPSTGKVKGQINLTFTLAESFTNSEGVTTPAGASVLLFTAGNLKYMIQRGEIIAGYYTKITRIADTKVKGLNSSQFEVEQDDERELSDAAFDKVEAATLTAGVKAAVQANNAKSAPVKAAPLARNRKILEESENA